MVNAGQLSCSSKMMRRRFVVATGSPAASEFLRYCLLLSLVCGFFVPAGYVLLRIVYAICVCAALHMFICLHSRRAAIPHSHLPAGIIATMRRVVNYHSSWVRQQQVELFDASGNPGSTAGRGFNPAGGAPGGG
ncbi:jacalin-related lectin 3-like [Dorcoceras hygrometricum]|uniref:Jacalin-related lectin 3-like n=1 Tax=Dorcoceras hygrometricum TaxID=472368 RepID=A0A2Z7BR73_9LAMI|nr:jacalin-related lectin 3-like [Dorcoceras hygrometricum]